MDDILIDNTLTDNGWYTNRQYVDYDILIDNTLTDNGWYTKRQYDRWMIFW